MANPDRASGFTPVGTVSGAPWQALIRRAVMADTSADGTNNHGDIYIGSPIKLNAAGLALPWESADTDAVGVCVGVGYVPAGEAQNEAGMFNAADLEKRYGNLTDSSSMTIQVYYAPAEDTIFEIQTATAITLQLTDYLDVGEIAATSTGSRTTSLSSLELGALGDSDVKIVGLPEYPDNDVALVNARAHVVFANTEFGAAR